MEMWSCAVTVSSVSQIAPAATTRSDDMELCSHCHVDFSVLATLDKLSHGYGDLGNLRPGMTTCRDSDGGKLTDSC